jgi:hypothetical protein
MENFACTIYVSIFLVLSILILIIFVIKTKFKEGWICVGIILFAALMVIPRCYIEDKRNVDYPYMKTYKVLLYFQDGGNETRIFECKGWEEPYMTRTNAAYIFNVGNYSIPCVTRYKILKIEKIPLKI